MKLDQNSYMEDNRGERFSPWCSYSDMFCSLLMIFILLFIFVMLQYVSAKANDAAENQLALQVKDTQIEEIESALTEAESALAAAQAEVALRDAQIAGVKELQEQLDASGAENERLEAQIAGLEEDQEADALLISIYNERISKLNDELDQTRIQLGTRNDELSTARTQLNEQSAALETAQARLDEKDTALSQAQADLEARDQALAEAEQLQADSQARISALQDEKSSLEDANAALIGEKQTLEGENQALNDAKTSLESEIDHLQAEIGAADMTIAAHESQIESLETELEEQQEKARSAQALYNAQSAALTAANAELESLRGDDSAVMDLQRQLEERDQALAQVAGIRIEIINQIRSALDSDGIEARVDGETGAIVMSSELLFGVNQADLRPEGRRFLDIFFPVYFRALSQGSAAESVAQIIVEGHTDTTGDYMSNLDLSLRRAQSVTAYCVSLLRGEDQQKLISMISAAGCSFSNPILNADGSVDMDRSRRVEVKFTLKDQYMIEEIARIIEN